MPPQSTQWVSQCQDWDEWNKAGPPYKIHGNSYYVGTCGISAILIAGDNGHILIDTGTEKGAEMVKANIKKLGFNPEDISILLSSHEHFDHVGGFAKMKSWTGADIVTSTAAAGVLTSGKDSEDDPQFAMHPPMAAVAVSRTVKNGDIVRLGNIKLTTMETPGHTPGALSWSWESCAGKDCLNIVYADSLSPVSSDSFRFSDHANYLASYREAIKRIAASKCDILLTPHPSASDMHKRLKAGTMRDSSACISYAQAISKRLDERLAKETQ